MVVGLNPLASLDTCLPQQRAAQPGARVLVSAPRFFSRDATDMVLALREALSEEEQGRQVEMWLAPEALRNADGAQAEGERCGAMLVLWEPHGTKLQQTLEGCLVSISMGIKVQQAGAKGVYSRVRRMLYRRKKGRGVTSGVIEFIPYRHSSGQRFLEQKVTWTI